GLGIWQSLPTVTVAPPPCGPEARPTGRFPLFRTDGASRRTIQLSPHEPRAARPFPQGVTMTRFFLTRLAIAAGCVVPAGAAALGQPPLATRPGTPPRIIWVRPGTPPARRAATVAESRPPTPEIILASAEVGTPAPQPPGPPAEPIPVVAPTVPSATE